MTRPIVTKEKMLSERVARFKEMEPTTDAFIDTVIPEYQRRIYNLIGKKAFERPGAEAKIQGRHDFHMGLIELEPGKGAGLHAHKTEEVFIPLDGKFVIFWGDEGENEVELDQWDTISVPVGIMRGFRNPCDHTLHVLAVVGKEDLGGPLEWPDELVEKANSLGRRFDPETGLLEEQG